MHLFIILVFKFKNMQCCVVVRLSSVCMCADMSIYCSLKWLKAAEINIIKITNIWLLYRLVEVWTI